MNDDGNEFFRSRRYRPPGPAAQGSESQPAPEPIDKDEIDREESDLEQRIVDAPTLALDPEPQRKWIVEDVVPDENLTIVSGKGGTGKTTLILMLGSAMLTHGEWLGLPVAQGPVVFVTSEDGRKDVNLTLRAILKGTGKSLAHCEGLHILPLADRDACPAQASSRLAALDPTPLWHAHERVIERRKPRLLILDSRAGIFGGEENNAKARARLHSSCSSGSRSSTASPSS